MNDLLAEVFVAHGGFERWTSVSAITARARVGGLLPSRFAGNKLEKFSVRVEVAEQRTVIDDFPSVGKRAVFDRGDVRIETHAGEPLDSRIDPRSAFFGLRGIRRNVHWDALDVAYFAGQALWNYLTVPLLLARSDVAVTEGEPWRESGQQWRRLEATFSPQIHTHCKRQTFFIDSDGLIRRHDFVAEPVGKWAKASLYREQHRAFDGLVFPIERRVLPRVPGGRVLSWPTLLTLNLDEIAIERDATHAHYAAAAV